LALTLLLGYLSFTLVETPTRRHLSQLKLSLGVISLTVATVSVAAPGIAIRLNGGIQNRLPHAIEIAALEAQNKNPRRDECLSTKGVSSPSCVYGGGSLKAVVLGDSHAASIVTAVVEARPTDEYSVMELTYDSCPSLFGIKRPPNYAMAADHHCPEFNDWVLKKLSEVPSEAPLIIINRTSAYALGPNEPGNGNQAPRIYFTRPYATPEPEFIREFSAHLIDSACTFARNRQVYLVRPLPEMGVNVPRATARSMLLGSDSSISIPLDAYRARHSLVWAAQNEASRRCGVKILDPLPYLCQDGLCHGTKNGRPLYYDDDHLSEYGNKLLTPMFAEVFGKGEILGSSSPPARSDAQEGVARHL
jgi:hypothetical protein